MHSEFPRPFRYPVRLLVRLRDGLTDRSAGGGYYGSPDATLLTSSERSGHVNPDYEASFYGFRVASIPEPTTLLLLGLGGLIVRRRRVP